MSQRSFSIVGYDDSISISIFLGYLSALGFIYGHFGFIDFFFLLDSDLENVFLFLGSWLKPNFFSAKHDHRFKHICVLCMCD